VPVDDIRDDLAPRRIAEALAVDLGAQRAHRLQRIRMTHVDLRAFLRAQRRPGAFGQAGLAFLQHLRRHDIERGDQMPVSQSHLHP